MKKRIAEHRKKRTRIGVIVFCFVMITTIMVSLAFFLPRDRTVEKNAESVVDSDEVKEFQTVRTVSPQPDISALGAILVSSNSGQIIIDREADRRLYPASTTKIMTALIALEELERLNLGLDAEVVVPKVAAGVEGSSIYLKEGERITMEELLYGLMLESGNDSAVAIAECMGPGQERFVARMNERASQIGCKNTNFKNPSGLPDDEHYTTARDLCQIAKEALKRDDFRTLVAAKSWEGGSAGRTFTNKNKAVHEYDGCTGVKIGYTHAAGRTLVASAKRGGKELIAVVLNDNNWFEDVYAMMDYGFEVLGVDE